MPIFILFITLMLLGCDNDPTSRIYDWNGSDAEFHEIFKLTDSAESNRSFFLVEKESGKPFSGEISRSEKQRVTKQTFSGGLLNGKSIKSSPDGSWVEANYKNGQLHGKMIFYDADGKARSTMNYQEGKLELVGVN